MQSAPQTWRAHSQGELGRVARGGPLSQTRLGATHGRVMWLVSSRFVLRRAVGGLYVVAVTPRVFGLVCLVGAVIGAAATVYFWIAANAATGVLFAVLTVLLLPSWLLYSAGWRRVRRR